MENGVTGKRGQGLFWRTVTAFVIRRDDVVQQFLNSLGRRDKHLSPWHQTTASCRFPVTVTETEQLRITGELNCHSKSKTAPFPNILNLKCKEKDRQTVENQPWMETLGIWENLCSPLALLKSLAQQSLLHVLGGSFRAWETHTKEPVNPRAPSPILLVEELSAAWIRTEWSWTKPPRLSALACCSQQTLHGKLWGTWREKRQDRAPWKAWESPPPSQEGLSSWT